MKKQVFTIILLLMGTISTFGQSFTLDATGTNDMRLRTNASDRLTILAGGNVGIGVLSPLSKLHVQNSSIGLTPSTSNVAIFESNNTTFLSILHGATNEGGILFGNTSGGSSAGSVRYDGNSNTMRFDTQGTIKMSIAASGNVGIGATPTATHKLYVNGSQFINSDLTINGLAGTGVRPLRVDANGLVSAGTATATTNEYESFISVSAASARKLGTTPDSEFRYMLTACLASLTSGVKYGEGQIVMPIEFPDGATLKEIYLSAIDNSNGHVLEAKLMKVPKTGTASTQTAIGSVNTAGFAVNTTVQEASSTFSSSTIIDNGENYYYILVDITSSSSTWSNSIALRGVKFRYFITY